MQNLYESKDFRNWFIVPVMVFCYLPLFIMFKVSSKDRYRKYHRIGKRTENLPVAPQGSRSTVISCIFENIRDTLSDAVCGQYDKVKTCCDGKWVIFEPADNAEFDD